MDTKVTYKGEEIELHISPYKIERKCNISVEDNFDNMFTLIDIAKDVRSKEAILNESLNLLDKRLFEEISKLDAQYVKAAIKVKQNISKKKFDKVSEEQKALFSQVTLKLLEECQTLADGIDSLNEEKKRIFIDNQTKSEEAIRYSLRHDKNYFNGLAMSVYNDEFYKNILELKSNREVKLNKKMRNTLYSLRNYYNRMTKKPSPFSTFASTEISIIEDQVKDKTLAVEQFHPKVYLNELVFKSLENLLLTDNSFLDNFYFKLNPTLQIKDGCYEFLNVDVRNAKMYYSENVVRIKRNPRIDLYIEFLSDYGNKPVFELVEEISNRESNSLNQMELIKEVLNLDRIGILFKNFNIYHQDYEAIQKLIQILSENKKVQYKKIEIALRDILEKINIINQDIENIELKRQLQEEIFDDIKIVFDDYPDDAFDFGYVKKNVLYENNTLPRINHQESIDKKIQKDFYLAEKLYRIFDNNYVQRIMFRNIFRKHYSLDAKVSVLEFYEVVSAEYKNSLVELLKDDEDINTIDRLQQSFLELLKERKSNNTRVININESDIEKIYCQAPKIMDDKMSYGVYYQNSGNDYVINNISPGIGRHVIRYVSDLPKNVAKQFIDIYQKHVKCMERGNLVYTDIGTSLGISINKHYEVLEKAFGYPKSMYKNEMPTCELRVAYDNDTDAVKLVDKDGVVYDSTPIGFLFPRISPGFYSFLSTFSNSRGASMSFWDRYYEEIEVDKADIVYYPRIVVNNNVAINRATWKIRGDLYGNIEDDENGYIDIVNNLFAKNDLPKRFFAKKSCDINAIREIGKSTAEWENIITNNKLRKPQYFDLNNYLDYGIFTSFLKTYQNLPLTIQEILPDSPMPVEHLIEINEIKQ